MKKRWLTIIFIVIFGHTAYANSRIDMNTIRKIESSGQRNALNHKSGARGHYQITAICLQEYNNFHKVKYTKDDLWKVDINERIAIWYFEVRIPALLKHFKLVDSVENRLICYNAGIGWAIKYKRTGKLPKETKDYIKKYGN